MSFEGQEQQTRESVVGLMRAAVFLGVRVVGVSFITRTVCVR